MAHNRKAFNALCTLAKREKKSFQLPAKTVKGTQSGNEFQAAGTPATEKARRPNMERRCHGTNS